MIVLPDASASTLSRVFFIFILAKELEWLSLVSKAAYTLLVKKKQKKNFNLAVFCTVCGLCRSHVSRCVIGDECIFSEGKQTLVSLEACTLFVWGRERIEAVSVTKRGSSDRRVSAVRCKQTDVHFQRTICFGESEEEGALQKKKKIIQVS